MISDKILPLLLIILIGFLCGKLGFFEECFLDRSSSLFYFLALPVVCLKGINSIGVQPVFLASYWGYLFIYCSIFALVGFLFKISGGKIKSLRKVLASNFFIKIAPSFGLTIVGYFFSQELMGRICLIVIPVVLTFHLLTGDVSSTFAYRKERVSKAAWLYFRRLFLHPIVIVVIMGVFLANRTTFLFVLLDNLVNMIYPAIMPCCLIGTGAKLSQSRYFGKI
jgi:predicted permease